MITVIGSSNTDFTIKVKRLPNVGETLSGGDLFTAGGGKGANQAAQIARLKKRVSFIGNIGRDFFGDKAIENLKRLGVDTRFVARDKVHKSGMAFIIVDRLGRNQIIVSPGSNHHLKVKHILNAKRLIEKSKIILLQLEIPYDIVKRSVQIAHKSGVRVILNPAPYRFRLDGSILSKVDILTPNEVEAEAVTGVKCRSRVSIKKAGRALLKKGVERVVITLGKNGAAVIDKDGSRFFEPPRVKPVDTTCAGDSFNASLAASLSEGKHIDDAVRFANTAAALTVTKMGAQSSLPTLREITSKTAR